MYLLKNSCYFELNGIVFKVPENYYIDAGNTGGDENDLFFESFDRSFQVSYKMKYNCAGIKESLSNTQLFIFDACQPIEEIKHNGLKWYCTTYGDEKEQYFDARFLIEETDSGSTEFEFSILTYNGDIERIKKSSEFKELFYGIQVI